MSEKQLLIEQFIKAPGASSGESTFGDMLQEMHRGKGWSFWNLDVRAFYTALLLSMTSLLEHGHVGKAFGVSNVNLHFLTASRGTSTHASSIWNSESNWIEIVKKAAFQDLK